MPKLLSFFTFFLLSLNIFSQECKSLEESIYFSYPKNSKDSTITVRSKDKLIETDLRTGDSMVWKIKWTGKCTYETEFVSGSKKLDPAVKSFLKENKFAFKVVQVTAQYFIAEAYLNKANGRPFYIDTAFFERKNYTVDYLLFTQVKSLADLKKQKFADTLKYAVICLYRKGKFPCSALTGAVFFDGKQMAVLPNKSAGIFKVYKEGTFEIETYIKEKSIKKTIEIQYGKTYYVRVDPVLFHSCGMEIIIDDSPEAKEEFESVL